MRIDGRTFKSLEGLRGYMAWTVVLSHVFHFSGYDANRSLQWVGKLLNGTAAVNVFIVVSGFVITHLLLARNERYGPYLIRRALRIVPIYYVCLLIALVLLPVQIRFSTHDWIADHAVWAHRFAAFTPNLADHFLVHLTLLHGIIPDSLIPESSWSILGPAWSLSLEWQFYLLAPFIVRLMRVGRIAELACVMVLLAIHVALHRQTAFTWHWPAFLPLSIHFFLLGILCRLHLPAIARQPVWVIPAVGFGGALLFHAWTYELVVWTIFFAAILWEIRRSMNTDLAATSTGAVLSGLAQNRLAIVLGRASYSTYLIHVPFLACVAWAGESWLGLQTPGSLTVLCLLALPVLAFLSMGLYEYVEAPFIRLGGRLAAAKPIVATETST